MPELTKCPNCHHEWSESEQEYQQCDTCGYPLAEKPTNEYDAEIDDETQD